MSQHNRMGGNPPDFSSIEYGDRGRIAQHLRQTVLDEITGANGGRVHTDFPRDRFFAGTLAAESADQFDDFDDDLQSKMKPSALGASVKLDNVTHETTVKIRPEASVWVRVNPTYDELTDRDQFISLADSEEDSSETEDLLPVFERLELDIGPIEIPGKLLNGGFETVPPTVQDEIDSKFEAAFAQAKADARASDLDLYIDVEDDDGMPGWAMESEEQYQTYLDERTGPIGFPEWEADLNLTVIEESSGLHLDVEFANTAEILKEDNRNTTRDPTLFEANLELKIDGVGEFVPFTFDPLPEDFRYNRDLWGHGRNCTIIAPEIDTVVDGDPPGTRTPREDPRTNHLRTTAIPEHQQLSYDSATRGPKPTFEALSDLEGGGLQLLKDIHKQMQAYDSETYEEAHKEYQKQDDWDQSVNGRGGTDEADFQEDRDAFRREMARFKRGIECLEEYPDTAGRAFELMNKTMREMHRGSFDSWRLFQLVFIVMLLPDVASREYDEFTEATWRADSAPGPHDENDVEDALDVVDVLWFPTGGGKTEAFLGVAVWSAFFDRFRGKDFGVTAWTRFPLRLLSMQQLQRMAETMMYADLTRREESAIASSPAHAFSVGFMVGKRNTPNQLTGYRSNKAAELARDDKRREDLKVLPTCPVCGSETRMEVIEEEHRLAHMCTGGELQCAWQQRDIDPETPYHPAELPVHIVDNELYRYAPTILAGTIDKVTAVGYQRKMAHLISGEMEYECPYHGFASLGECTEKYGCEIPRDEFEDYATPVEPYDPAPSLEVPDELHLLNESMGSFDAHYETGIHELQEMADAGQTKIIAPTATITSYDDQVYHLFVREAERFPAPGPYLRGSFYAEESPELQRQYIGITPHGKTHINAIIDLLFYYHKAIQDLLVTAVEEPDKLLDGDILIPDSNAAEGPLDVESVPELLDMLGDYTTSLTYLLAKKDGDRLDQSIRLQLADYFHKLDRPELNPDRMTGGTQFDEVQERLDKLENPWHSGRDQEIVSSLIDQDIVDEENKDVLIELRDIIDGCLHDDQPTSVYHDALERAPDEVGQGLAYLLASRLNSITATSMISHGVDIDRFNMMIFFGMPRDTSEYIQSSSRAGRTHPGLIFNVFHPIRERDQSHYHFFEKYHQFLDRLVEPVPINRWAKNSIQRTHPGLFMGLLLNHYMYEDDADRLFFGSNARQFVQNLDDESELSDAIHRMYGGDAVPEEFADTAEALTKEAIDDIQLNDDEKWTSNRLGNSVMTSLRDIDKKLRIQSTYRSKDVFDTLDRRR
ncbi:helicase-related protein [Halorubrum cibi]|uniref:Helicase conserved C-terminal domain-containing protein n=1 Tax=Halorubrum cibi TaxID=413815 RepID=A0A521EQ25_9EURY|nr:helicase-related protein [Halorubrum cibi]SMO86026.1 Helicase conserved C-terminal domain-containing protein [Halorubrum cibi]